MVAYVNGALEITEHRRHGFENRRGAEGAATADDDAEELLVHSDELRCVSRQPRSRAGKRARADFAEGVADLLGLIALERRTVLERPSGLVHTGGGSVEPSAAGAHGRRAPAGEVDVQVRDDLAQALDNFLRGS